MGWTDRHLWVGERIGALTYVRRYTPGGWYLLPKPTRLQSMTAAEWDWGADTAGARALAAAILLDAFADSNLVGALLGAFHEGPISALQTPTWSYTAVQLAEWLGAHLMGRLLATAAEVERSEAFHHQPRRI